MLLKGGKPMPVAAAAMRPGASETDLSAFLPESLRKLDDPQKDIPRIARDAALVREIEQALVRVPTTHHLHRQDARTLRLPPGSVHLVLTSPPYWTLKEYNPADGQLGHVADYDQFLA